MRLLLTMTVFVLALASCDDEPEVDPVSDWLVCLDGVALQVQYGNTDGDFDWSGRRHDIGTQCGVPPEGCEPVLDALEAFDNARIEGYWAPHRGGWPSDELGEAQEMLRLEEAQHHGAVRYLGERRRCAED